MFCTQCGTQVSDGVKFCPSCGNNLRADAEASKALPRLVRVPGSEWRSEAR